LFALEKSLNLWHVFLPILPQKRPYEKKNPQYACEENKTTGKRPGFENMSASPKLKLIQIYHSCMVMAKIR
jgi:hypothetical protein